MTVEDLKKDVADTLRRAYEEFSRKCDDYRAPDGTALGDIFKTAVDLEMPPRKVLYIHHTKHLQAYRRVVNGEELRSETFRNRVQDSIIYHAMMLALIEEEELVKQNEELKRDDVHPTSDP